MGNIWGPNGGDISTVTVYIHPARYTQEFMAKYDTFTVSFFPESYRKALGYLGSHSGRDENKVANSGLTPVAAGDGVTFKEAELTFVCKKMCIRDRTLTKQALLEYIKTVLPKANNLRIIYKKVYNDQLLKIDGFNYYLGGRSNDRFCIDNAIQLIVPLEIQFYIKLVEKFTAIISENKNIALKASSVKSRNPINNQVENITLEYTDVYKRQL